MLAVLRHRDFTLLWSGGLIALAGDYILITALPFFIYSLTGSALAAGLLFACYTAPSILFGSVAGVFVDRWDRKRTMVIANLLRAVVLLPLLFVRSPEWVWVIYVALFAQTSIALFFVPAENALLPTLIGEQHLMAANSLNALNDSLARLLGPALGGMLLGLLGVSGVALANVTTYLIAAGMIALIVARATLPSQTRTATVARSPWGAIWREWIDGLRLVRQSRIVTGLFVVMVTAMVGSGIINTLIVVFVQDVIGGDAVAFGWIMTLQGIGGIVGGVLMGMLGSRFAAPRLLAGGLVLAGATLAGIIYGATLTLTFVLIPIIGAGFIAAIVSLQTMLQRNVEDAYRGRVFATFGTIVALASILGTTLAGAFGDQVGALPMLYASAGLFASGGALAAVLLQGEAQERVEIEQPAVRGNERLEVRD
jgi:predicted MFS family arabinose efflux permease